jgi:hypothetical protein
MELVIRVLDLDFENVMRSLDICIVVFKMYCGSYYNNCDSTVVALLVMNLYRVLVSIAAGCGDRYSRSVGRSRLVHSGWAHCPRLFEGVLL